MAEQSTLGGQSLKLSSKAAAFKRVSLLIGAKHVNWGGGGGGAGPLGSGRVPDFNSSMFWGEDRKPHGKV